MNDRKFKIIYDNIFYFIIIFVAKTNNNSSNLNRYKFTFPQNICEE